MCEVADAEPPHRPGGCPFQAWSLGELLRLERVVLATEAPRAAGAERRGGSPLAGSAIDPAFIRRILRQAGITLDEWISA